jgi:hypothetical protein
MADETPQNGAPKKSNVTPDLSDEQYMEQLFLIAQAIAVMPGQRDTMPNVTTPPPIRPRWAAFMLSLGLRLHPELATHRLANQEGAAVGNWGPRERVEVSTQRSTMNRADLNEVWQQMNPETFAKAQAGEVKKEDLIKMLPAELQQAIAMTERLREQEQRQRQDQAAREAREKK